jgi:tRNA G10  N-methylase Trm11
MILNITLGRNINNSLILDPFCGMGTILTEAIVMGANKLIGSDLKNDVILKTEGNINWIKKTYEINPQVKYLVSDATHISTKLQSESVDAIITEPFMGSRLLGLHKLEIQKIKSIAKGLDKLYIGCLRDWYKVLKKNGLICMAFPVYHIKDKQIFVKKAIDTCENLGYTKVLGPIEYSRDQAVVIRNFYIFKKLN